MDENNDGKISREDFFNLYMSSKLFEALKQRRDTLVEQEEEAEKGGASLRFLLRTKGRIFYIVTAPILYSLYYTIPDVMKKRWRKWWSVTIIISLAWLTFYVYLMVWWSEALSEITGLHQDVIGITLLSAGI